MGSEYCSGGRAGEAGGGGTSVRMLSRGDDGRGFSFALAAKNERKDV